MAASIDLHMHTTYSDGTSEPEALLQAVAAQGVKTLAVTDHDTTAAYGRLLPEAERLGIELIRGIEINTHWNESEVHVLGYYIDFENSDLQSLIKEHRSNRLKQLKAMVDRINGTTNAKLDFSVLEQKAYPDSSLGRPHLARAMLEQKAVRTISEAFDKYLNSRSGTYVKRPTCSPHEAVEAIYNSGGIPVIAHPGLSEKIELLVPELLVYGLQGLEAYHKGHSPPVIEFICTLAEKHDLMVTGGTDFHGLGPQYATAHSRLVAPDYIKENLRKRHRSRQQSVLRFKAS